MRLDNDGSATRLREARRMKHDPLLGRSVEIRSASGIVYRGTVRAIDRHDEFSERFELEAGGSGELHEVYVNDRAAEVREV